MNRITDRKSLFFPYASNAHPGFSINCVILGFHKKKIRVLLNKFSFSNYWQLPGGFMLRNENADEAAKRILIARTGLQDIFLRQFHLFSDPHRMKIEQNIEYVEKALNKDMLSDEEATWHLERFVCLGYYALVQYNEIQLLQTDEVQTKWFEIDNLPSLYADHGNQINTSLEIIRTMLSAIPIGNQLLPEKFTMSELRKIYEIILGKTLDRRNFHRKVLASGMVTQLNETQNTRHYNPPILYAFDKKKIDIFYHPFGLLR